MLKRLALAFLLGLTAKIEEHSVLIQEAVVDHVRVDDAELGGLHQDVVLFKVLARGEFLGVAAALIIAWILHIVVTGRLLLFQSFVFIQKFGRS